jgi:hypothetical protein
MLVEAWRIITSWFGKMLVEANIFPNQPVITRHASTNILPNQLVIRRHASTYILPNQLAISKRDVL